MKSVQNYEFSANQWQCFVLKCLLINFFYQKNREIIVCLGKKL